MFQTAETVLIPNLDPGERLLWSGQPRTGVRLRASDAFLIPFSLLWSGFAVFWEGTVFHMNAPLFFKLWGVPFVLVGVYMVFGRFFADARMRERTFYGVTNERILIIRGLFTQQTKSLPLRNLPEVTLTQRNDGSGTIAFGPTFYASGFPADDSMGGRRRYAAPAFDMIERVKDVYDIIRKAQREASANG
jgi:hypothetical protein